MPDIVSPCSSPQPILVFFGSIWREMDHNQPLKIELEYKSVGAPIMSQFCISGQHRSLSVLQFCTCGIQSDMVEARAAHAASFFSRLGM